MSGRPVQKKANIPELKKLLVPNTVTDHRPLIAFVMRNSGCTFAEIGEVFGLTRQQAETIFKNAKEKAEKHEI